jgi:hypothetical protein
MHYECMMRTHTQIVAEAGEAALVAALGLSRFTVQSWRKRNSIPAPYWPRLVEMDAASIEELAEGVQPRRRAVASL